MKKLMFLLLSCCSFYSLSAQLDFDFTEVATGFSSPVDIANDGFNSDRLYIVERGGRIKLMEKINGNWVTNGTVFLDIATDVTTSDNGGDERGLLGLAFHPDFENNGYLYVNYINGATNATRKTVVERYTVNGNATVADATSDFLIIEIAQPYSNHNGGDLNFGPDNMLYIGMGDGGSGNDPQERSQNLNELNGKMLRLDINNIDVVNSTNYTIPADNPFVGQAGVRGEIWAYGLRNPWRFSFDRLTGDMWIGDVGQNALEEVDFQPANSTGGENYGWDCYEAANSQYNNGEHPDCFDANGNPLITHSTPVFQVNQNTSGGNSITGGYVYRGAYSNLRGHYFVIDYARHNVWSIEKNGSAFMVEPYGNKGVFAVTTFGEDLSGELYIAEIGGSIHQLTTTAVLPLALSVFEGMYENKQVKLNWIDTENSNSSHFEIERSANGTDFNYVGKVMVQGTTNMPTSYSFTDESPAFSDIYYRLKMVDKDDSVAYSRALIIDFKGQAELSIFPNPHQGNFTLLINGQTDQIKPIAITIRAITGEIVYQEKHVASLLPFDQQLFLESLPNGVYDVEVLFDGQILQHQMVKGK